MIKLNTLPDGYSSITPYFTVDDADIFIKFATDVFGASIIKENRDNLNRIQHARILIGSSVIMLNESSENYPVNISQMHLYVEDVDRIYERALQSEATTLMAPNYRPHGDRMAGIKDPCGNVLWIATHTNP